MIKVGIVDSNEHARNEYKGIVDSVVGGWLQWEFDKADCPIDDPNNSDIVLLVHSGAVDYVSKCRSALRLANVDKDKQYIITGGAIANNPIVAFELAHALVVGEAYKFIRLLIKLIKAGKNLSEIQDWIYEYEFAIEYRQTLKITYDKNRPWLFKYPAIKIAEPDQWVDWGNYPPIRSSDHVVRLIGSKGCHKKCLFCSTTYNQSYRVNEKGSRLIAQMNGLKLQGERIQIISNDPANLPFFKNITGRMDSQSFTLDEITDKDNLRIIIKAGVGIVRVGVEGLSERIRKAFGKPILNKKLLHIIKLLHEKRINTHMFFIVGSPYESKEDWIKFKEFYAQLSDTLKYGVCRIKMTTFLPTPPAPLVRFIPGNEYEQLNDNFLNWMRNNYANPHILYISGRKSKNHLKDISEQVNIPREYLQMLLNNNECYDIAPEYDDWLRLPWEMIKWPINSEKRYRIGEIYKKRMVNHA